MLTLADYSPRFEVREWPKIKGAKRALFDGRTCWVSPAMANLIDGAIKDGEDELRRFLACVDVAIVENAKRDWREAF